jgi:hypothetical protein
MCYCSKDWTGPEIQKKALRTNIRQDRTTAASICAWCIQAHASAVRSHSQSLPLFADFTTAAAHLTGISKNSFVEVCLPRSFVGPFTLMTPVGDDDASL